ncbi:chalcone isomerase family protein [Ramlibacter humi]|nr:chalcone isomerase family protein [Ramlibacter humi]
MGPPLARAAGANFPERVSLGQHEVILNGAGVRYRAIFQVYAAAFYSSDRKTKESEVYSREPRRMAMVMLREVTSDELGRAFINGVYQNTDRAEVARMVGPIARFGAMFGTVAKLRTGDTLTVDWIPGAGTVVQLNGKSFGEPVPDPAFYNALLRIWFGERPADPLLKKALLGERAGQESY